MTSLLFLGCVAGIFLLIIAMESDPGVGRRLRYQPTGLFAWITGGNWPAKVGAALIVVGVGALLRYAMVNIDVPDSTKLGAGIMIVAALGFMSAFAPGGPSRKTVSLALGGAAFGVAYLTAYSAFALFNFVPSAQGLALLALVSAGAGAYAVTRGAMSLGVLAMFGAYLAPAFAVADPGPLVVYSYYVAASVMTLILVALRGWRPLIHLSFLFTLAGGSFLAWTSSYYDPTNADVMLPMLLLLAALHVAMPVAERGGSKSTWIERLDVVYLIALPSIVAVLTFGMATSSADFSVMMLWFGAIWAVAAIATRLRKRSGAAALAAIGVLFLILAAAARFKNIPWELLGLAASVIGLWLATWRQPANGSLQGVAAGFVALFGASHVLATLSDHASGALFINAVFIERLVGAVLLITAGILCRRARQALDTLLLATGLLWLFIALGMELVRWKIANVALVANWLFILLAASVWIPGRKWRWADNHPTAVGVMLALTAWWAAQDASPVQAWITLLAAASAGLALAARTARMEHPFPMDRHGPVITTVAAVSFWGLAVAPPLESGGLQFQLTLAGIAALLAMAIAHRLTKADDQHTEDLVTGAATCFAGVLCIVTLLHISRAPWAMTLEVCCLVGLALAAVIRRARGTVPGALLVTLAVGFALTIQAHLVRWLAPAGPLSFSSVLELREPALISLLWVAMGCVLTYWSRRGSSRSLWIAGATLLVLSAVKMMLMDFGSLGQLTNILAVIAAGVVFMLVGWLAPIPPAAVANTAATKQRNGRNPATVAILLVIAIGLIEVGVLRPGSIRPSTYSPDVSAVSPNAPPVETIQAVPVDPVTDSLANVAPAPEPVAEPSEEPVVVEMRIPAPAPRRAEATTETASSQYVRPPVVEASGMRNYNDLSYPVERTSRPPGSTSSASSVQFAAPPSPGDKEQGLDTLVRQGRLARATQRDLDEFMSRVRGDPAATARLQKGDRMVLSAPMQNVYVVRRELTLPTGLYGAHSATFIVPRGVTYPFGEKGHSDILQYPDNY